MERRVVVKVLARQHLDALGVLGRELGTQPDDDAPEFRIEENRVLRIEAGRQRCGQRRYDADERDHQGNETDHGRPQFQRPDLPANLAWSRRKSAAGTNAATSPPIAAIWPTSVAVVGRPFGEAGRHTGSASRGHASLNPAIATL